MKWQQVARIPLKAIIFKPNILALMMTLSAVSWLVLSHSNLFGNRLSAPYTMCRHKTSLN